MLCCLTKHFSFYNSVLVIYRTVKKQLPRHFVDQIFSRPSVVKPCAPHWSNNNLHQWMVWPCCSYSIFELLQQESQCSQQNQQHQEVVKENRHIQSMGCNNCAEGLKRSPYFRFSMLYLARRVAKLKNTLNYGFLSFRTNPARLTSTGDPKGFVSSWERCWVMTRCLLLCKSAQTLFQDLNCAFPLSNPVLHAHKPCWPEQWESCIFWMQVEIRKNKTLWLFQFSFTFLTFKITLLSHEVMYCTGELLSECKGGNFAWNIIVSKSISSLIH